MVSMHVRLKLRPMCSAYILKSELVMEINAHIAECSSEQQI